MPPKSLSVNDSRSLSGRRMLCARVSSVSERGFGLLEALIGLGLLVTALVGIAEVFVIARRAVGDGRVATSEVVLATQRIEQLGASSFDEVEWGEQVEELPPFV